LAISLAHILSVKPSSSFRRVKAMPLIFRLEVISDKERWLGASPSCGTSGLDLDEQYTLRSVWFMYVHQDPTYAAQASIFGTPWMQDSRNAMLMWQSRPTQPPCPYRTRFWSNRKYAAARDPAGSPSRFPRIVPAISSELALCGQEQFFADRPDFRTHSIFAQSSLLFGTQIF
jgi:hypothetical protein